MCLQQAFILWIVIILSMPIWAKLCFGNWFWILYSFILSSTHFNPFYQCLGIESEVSMWQEQGKDSSLSLYGCCQADMVEVEGGWWWLMMTSRAAGLFVLTLWILCALRMPRLLVLELQWKCETSAWGCRATLMVPLLLICNESVMISLCGLCIEQCPGNLGQQVVK